MIEIAVRMRGTVRPLAGADGSIIGTATELDPTGSTARNRYRTSCEGGSIGGRGTIAIEAGLARGGVIYRNTKAVPQLDQAAADQVANLIFGSQPRVAPPEPQ